MSKISRKVRYSVSAFALVAVLACGGLYYGVTNATFSADEAVSQSTIYFYNASQRGSIITDSGAVDRPYGDRFVAKASYDGSKISNPQNIISETAEAFVKTIGTASNGDIYTLFNKSIRRYSKDGVLRAQRSFANCSDVSTPEGYRTIATEKDRDSTCENTPITSVGLDPNGNVYLVFKITPLNKWVGDTMLPTDPSKDLTKTSLYSSDLIFQSNVKSIPASLSMSSVSASPEQPPKFLANSYGSGFGYSGSLKVDNNGDLVSYNEMGVVTVWSEDNKPINTFKMPYPARDIAVIDGNGDYYFSDESANSFQAPLKTNSKGQPIKDWQLDTEHLSIHANLTNVVSTRYDADSSNNLYVLQGICTTNLTSEFGAGGDCLVRITKFDSNGKFISSWSAPSVYRKTAYTDMSCTFLNVDKINGNIIVTTKVSANVYDYQHTDYFSRYSNEGKLLAHGSIKNTDFERPQLDSQGNFYLASRGIDYDREAKWEILKYNKDFVLAGSTTLNTARAFDSFVLTAQKPASEITPPEVVVPPVPATNSIKSAKAVVINEKGQVPYIMVTVEAPNVDSVSVYSGPFPGKSISLKKSTFNPKVFTAHVYPKSDEEVADHLVFAPKDKAFVNVKSGADQFNAISDVSVYNSYYNTGSIEGEVKPEVVSPISNLNTKIVGKKLVVTVDPQSSASTKVSVSAINQSVSMKDKYVLNKTSNNSYEINLTTDNLLSKATRAIREALALKQFGQNYIEITVTATLNGKTETKTIYKTIYAKNSKL